MAILALVFVFGVAFNDLAGHHQLFENIRLSLGRREQQKPSAQNKTEQDAHASFYPTYPILLGAG